MQLPHAKLLARSNRAGFTLIEVLVVITIIAVLVVISSAVFFRMRESAKSVLSANNLRQWGQALVLYTADNNGAIPFEGPPTGSHGEALAVAKMKPHGSTCCRLTSGTKACAT